MNWEHSQRLLTKDGLSIPHPSTIPTSTWEDNVLGWPEVVCEKILKYFLDSVAVDGDAMQNLKAAAAFDYLHSNKIGSVLMHKHDRFVLLNNNNILISHFLKPRYLCTSSDSTYAFTQQVSIFKSKRSA